MIDFSHDFRPIFLVHQSYQQRNRLAECIEYLNDSLSSDIRVGTIVRLPTLPPQSAEKYVDECSDHTQLIIVDPELYKHKDSMDTAKTAAANYTFMNDDLPEDPDDEWIESILNKQRDYGATVLLTPSWMLNTDANIYSMRQLLKRQLEVAQRSVQLVRTEEPALINLTLHYSWLAIKENLHLLLNELTDLDHDHYYIRVYWPPMKPRYGQLADKTILAGYKELSITMGLEEKTLILPTTSLTGWLNVAFGAAGFSLGPSMDQQCFAQEIEVLRAKGSTSPQRRERYFSPSLLHVIDRVTHDLIFSDSGLVQCDCRYCKELDANNPKRKKAWSHECASLHQIVATAGLTSRLKVRNPRAKAHEIVKEAIDFQNSFNKMLVGENRPKHLQVWDELLK